MRWDDTPASDLEPAWDDDAPPVLGGLPFAGDVRILEPPAPRRTRDRRDENAARRTPGGRVRIMAADVAQLHAVRAWLASGCRREPGPAERAEWLRALGRLATGWAQRQRAKTRHR